MIDINTGELKDLWPDETSPEFLSISYAIKLRLADIILKASKVGIAYNIDGLDEGVLDYLALELKAPYYEQSLPIEKKRELVKSALIWRSKAGTSGAVQEAIKTIFGYGELEEWYQNGGDMDTFEVVLNSSQAESEDIEKITNILEWIKNVRSHYAGLTFQDKKALKLKTDDDTAYQYEVPKCGTLPYPAAVGKQHTQDLVLKKKAITAAANLTEPGSITTAGTHPHTSEFGAADRVTLKAGTKEVSALANIAEPGSKTAGTHPYTSERGAVERTAIAAKTKEVSAERTALMPSDKAVAGTTPTVSTTAALDSVSIANRKAEASGAHPAMKPGEKIRPKQ